MMNMIKMIKYISIKMCIKYKVRYLMSMIPLSNESIKSFVIIMWSVNDRNVFIQILYFSLSISHPYNGLTYLSATVVTENKAI